MEEFIVGMANIKAVQCVYNTLIHMYLDWKVVVATSSRFDDMKDISVHPFWRQPKSRAKRLSGENRQECNQVKPFFLPLSPSSVPSVAWFE